MSIKTKFFHLIFLFMRPMTLGARVVATNKKGEVALVKHTYVKGWHLPGGGVDVGEDCMTAAIRELREETGIETDITLSLFGIYFNRKATRRDHVTLYLALDLDAHITRKPDREIKGTAFFALDALPEDITEATRQRLDEVFNSAERSAYW